jgi:SWI/SNF-related matrix-associated actin-dependent regulator of chromatin subfamily A member 5
LIIVPLSVALNWIRECKKWTPSLTHIKLQGNMQSRDDLLSRQEVLSGAYDLVITTFETVICEIDYFKSLKWLTIIMDEAHRIKNSKSTLAELMCTMKSPFKLLLTGTPLQVHTQIIIQNTLLCA